MMVESSSSKIHNPKVSIIVPIYGVENFIEKCATSLFNQTYNNIEFIFVNDCTKDRSMEKLASVIELYPNLTHCIKIINQSENKGLAAARHRGITESSGTYIFHLDSDDWLDIDAIECFVQEAYSKDSDMVVGDFYMSYSDKESIQKVRITEQSDYISRMLERNRDFSWTLCNRLIKREIQIKVYPIDNLNMGEDYVTVPRLVYYCKNITHTKRPLYHYRQTNSSSYTKSISLKSISDLVMATSILHNFFSDKINNTVFLKSLEIGKMRIKYDLYLSANTETRKSVYQIFPNINSNCAISIPEKIVFTLAQHQMFGLMGLFVRVGLSIKQILK